MEMEWPVGDWEVLVTGRGELLIHRRGTPLPRPDVFVVAAAASQSEAGALRLLIGSLRDGMNEVAAPDFRVTIGDVVALRAQLALRRPATVRAALERMAPVADGGGGL